MRRPPRLLPALRVFLPLPLALVAGSCAGGEPASAPPPSYVGRESCVVCHADQATAYAGSHHDLAMQPATEETVLGDFDDAVFEGASGTTRFLRRGAEFVVRTTGPDGATADFPVRWVFGVEPLQQVLIELDAGRVQCLTVAWDVEQQRWYDLYPGEAVAADDELHWTGRYQRWNTMCAACHSTDLAKAYDPRDDAYATTFAEIDVSCEACHGPGSAHVEWARSGAAEGDEDPTPRGRGLVANLRRGAAAAQVETCAPCHSRRSALTERPLPGEPFLDGHLPERLHEGLYFPDGQIQDEVYVWGSFVQSRMHARGVACSDCHDPHSLDLWVPGDAVCLQCHSEAAPLERFPTLTARAYDTPEHHHHPVDSEGARCVACHMPARTYMGIDARRDHGLRVPRPDVSRALGTPDACTGCHGDRDLDWAVETVAGWTGRAPDPEAHFAAALAAGRRGEAAARPHLLRVIADGDLAPIVRATALELLAPHAAGELPTLRQALSDPEPLVRFAALRAAELLPAVDRLPLVRIGAADPVRAVRAEAGRLLPDLPIEDLPPHERGELEAAEAEYLEAQRVGADLPASWLNVGVHHERAGRPAEALEAYLHALEQDVRFLPARHNAATLEAALGRPERARELLQEGLELHPADGELHYSLGLVLAELGSGPAAARHLTEAAASLADRPRVQYNAMLAAWRAGWGADARRFLERALALAPDDLDVLHAGALFLLEQQEADGARELALRVVDLTAGAPWALELLERAGGR